MKKYSISILLPLLVLMGCEGFLDERPSKKIIVPSTLDDLRSILDNTSDFNRGINFGIILSDDMVSTDQGVLGFGNDWEREAYKWSNDLNDANGNMSAWNFPYLTIFRCNLILEIGKKLSPENARQIQELDEIIGSAHFQRAKSYYYLLEFYSLPLRNGELQNIEGVPIKTDTDVNVLTGRSDASEVLNLIFEDLEKAVSLLPDWNNNPIRPSKASTYGLLSKIYLVLGHYEKALGNAERALSLKSDLMDYDEIASQTLLPLPFNRFPFASLNKEIIYFEEMGTNSFVTSPLSFVSPDLISSYAENDLRKDLYFSKSSTSENYLFQGHYTGNFQPFSGIGVDEIILIKSECLARLDRIDEAAQALNTLLEKRYRKNNFQPLAFDNADLALQEILSHRRKSLVRRGFCRWSDLKRFLGETWWNGPLGRTFEGNEFSPGTDPWAYQLILPIAEVQANPFID